MLIESDIYVDNSLICCNLDLDIRKDVMENKFLQEA